VLLERFGGDRTAGSTTFLLVEIMLSVKETGLANGTPAIKVPVVGCLVTAGKELRLLVETNLFAEVAPEPSHATVRSASQHCCTTGFVVGETNLVIVAGNSKSYLVDTAELTCVTSFSGVRGDVPTAVEHVLCDSEDWKA